MGFRRSFMLFVGCSFFVGYCNANNLSAPRTVAFQGEGFHESFDLSAVARIGDYIVVGSDEGHVIQVLRRKNINTFVLERKYSLPEGEKTDRAEKNEPELDIEGIAASGQIVYIIGSHASKRKKVGVKNAEGRSHNENRERLTKTKKEKARRVLIQLKLDENGKLDGKVKLKNLWNVINQFSELEPFTTIPSKENGIDIEGIAVKGETLYVGFRGPVLRGNWVPVLVTQFSHSRGQAELRFINLGGLGIRDIVSVNEQFLLIAGPVGDGPGGYHLYSWNGLDCIPGKNGAEGVVQYLGQIPAERNTKAEGLTVLSNHQASMLELLVLFDGSRRGTPLLFHLKQ